MTEAIALVSGGLSFLQASQQNSAAREARDQTIASSRVAANQRSAITARNLAELQGSIRATAAGRGVAGSQSAFALGLSATESGLLERQNIEMQRFMEAGSAQSRYASQYTNPLVAGITGYAGAGGTFGIGGGSGTSPPTGRVSPVNDPFPYGI